MLAVSDIWQNFGHAGNGNQVRRNGMSTLGRITVKFGSFANLFCPRAVFHQNLPGVLKNISQLGNPTAGRNSFDWIFSITPTIDC